MPVPKTKFRFIETVNYSANNQVILRIPPGLLFKGIWLKLRGTFTITDADGACTLLVDNPATLLTDIELNLNGQMVLKKMDGGMLYRLTQFDSGTLPYTNAVTSGAVGVTNFYADMCLNFQPDIFNKFTYDTLLVSQRYNNLLLKLTFGDEDQICTGGGVTTALSNTAVDVWVEEVDEPAKLDPSGLLERVIIKDVTAAGAGFKLDIQTKNILVESLFRDYSDGDVSGAVMTDVNLIRDNTDRIIDNLPVACLTSQSKSKRKLETYPTGYLHVDHMEKGRSLSGINCSLLKSLEYSLTVLHPGTTDKILLMLREVVPRTLMI